MDTIDRDVGVGLVAFKNGHRFVVFVVIESAELDSRAENPFLMDGYVQLGRFNGLAVDSNRDRSTEWQCGSEHSADLVGLDTRAFALEVGEQC